MNLTRLGQFRAADRDCDERQGTTDVPPTSPSLVQIAVWALLLALSIALAAVRARTFQVGVWGDDGAYALLARSLIESDRYGFLAALDQPGGILWFPFGYPLLISPVVFLLPGNLAALQVPSLAATLLSATLLFWGWRWLSRRSSYWWGLAVTALFVTSTTTISWATMVMSEAAFTTFYLLAVILSERLARDRSSRWWPILLGVALVFVVFTRTIGVVLALSILAYLLVTKGRSIWPSLALTSASGAAVLGLVIALTPVTLADVLPIRYVQEYRPLAGTGEIITDAAREPDPQPTAEPGEWRQGQPGLLLEAAMLHVTDDLREVILPLRGGRLESALSHWASPLPVTTVLGLLTFGLVALGFVRSLNREGASLFVVSALVFLGSLFFWLWKGPRMLYPVQPQLFLAFLLGVEAIAAGLARIVNWGGRTVGLINGVLGVAVLALVLGFAYRNVTVESSVVHVGDLEAQVAWLEQNALPSATVMAENPQLILLYTNRRTTAYPSECRSAGDLDEYLVARGVDYALVTPSLAWQPAYSPSFSPSAVCVRANLLELVSAGRASLAYSSTGEEVQVYKIQAAQRAAR